MRLSLGILVPIRDHKPQNWSLLREVQISSPICSQSDGFNKMFSIQKKTSRSSEKKAFEKSISSNFQHGLTSGAPRLVLFQDDVPQIQMDETNSVRFSLTDVSALWSREMSRLWTGGRSRFVGPKFVPSSGELRLVVVMKRLLQLPDDGLESCMPLVRHRTVQSLGHVLGLLS